MTLEEMHVWFRQYAQQMGMQNVRALLPEQIDLLINTSINDYVNQVIKENIGITNDRVITDNSKIGQINALRGLYTVKEIELFSVSNYHDMFFVFNKADAFVGKITNNTNTNLIDYLYIVDLSLNYKKTQSKLTTTLEKEKHFYVIDEKGNFFSIKDVNEIDVTTTQTLKLNVVSNFDNNVYQINALWKKEDNIWYIVPKSNIDAGEIGNDEDYGTSDLYIGFNDKGKLCISNDMNDLDCQFNDFILEEGTNYPFVYSNRDTVTNYFPVRIIDDAYLADTLNDFVLRNRVRSPIATFYNKNNLDIYIEPFIKQSDGYNLPNSLIPYKLRVSYIAKPAKVKYLQDVNGVNVDCNLPEYTHVDILKHAVDLYRVATSGSLHASQQQEQAQQQENVRNGYRNEGNANQQQQ